MDLSGLGFTDAEWPRRSPRMRRPTHARSFAHLCPNCELQFTATTGRALYCTMRCHDEAKTVRYARRKHEQYGIDLPTDIRDAIQIRLAHVLSGGYDAAARRLTLKVREEVWERDGGRCVLCHAPGQDVDHIDGPSSDLCNLRLVCKACHNGVTLAHLHPTGDPAVIARAAALRQRVDAAEPLLPCDAADWSRRWLQWVKDHVVETDHADLPSKIQTPPGRWAT